MMRRCLELKSTLFTVLTIVDIAEVENLEIHKGKDPSVALKCFKGAHNIKIHFPGDMERQKFVE